MTILETLNHPNVKHWMPGAINTAVLILLTASLAQWTWLLVKPTMPQVIVDNSADHNSNNAKFSIQPLLSAYLFGRASESINGASLDNLPVSSLNLKLTGVIASGQGGHALIAVNDKKQEPFAVGEAITGGAVLQAVYPDRAVIMRNGAMESLLLEQPELGRSALQPNITPSPRSKTPVRTLSTNNYVVSRNDLNEQIRGPNFLKHISLAPLSSGGFLVRKVQANSMYSKLGLRAGDVIKTVNNQTIKNIDDMMRFYQQLSQLGQVQLEITRAGKSETLNYRLE